METKIKARRRMMDMIASRDHSEKELRTKLKEKLRFEDAEDSLEAVEAAIAYAKEHQWLGDPAKLAGRLADILHRKNKGIDYINHYLNEKGLPIVSADHDLELEKALHLVKNKFRANGDEAEGEKPEAEKARVARFLASRGFDSETVRKVIYEKL